MGKFVKNKKGELVEIPPYKCRVCGLGDIEMPYNICCFCGWEDDGSQSEDPDYTGGPNHMSFNEYKKFWEENKEDILKNLPQNRFYAILRAKEYFRQNFKDRYEKIRKRLEEKRQKERNKYE